MSSRGTETQKAFARSLPLLLVLLVLGGCASFGEGFGRALMKKDSTDTRACYVRGTGFDGIEQMMERDQQGDPNSGKDLKLLMVHGIGTHLPGYSTRLAENLARELNLDVMSRAPKIITLRFQMPTELWPGAQRERIRNKTGDKIGTVTVNHYQSKSGERRMVFYELTWSEITEPDKRIIAYDDSGEYSFRRAGLNADLKKFVNSHMPDPLIYMGDAQFTIQQAVAQTLCWMMTRDYAQLPKQTDELCQVERYKPTEVEKDSYVFVSHSLGSRILTDAWQKVTGLIAKDVETRKDVPQHIAAWWRAFQNKTMTIFMLSNQLPLLQLGRAAPEVTNQIEDYCTPGGANYERRIFARTNIIAFSDPNDILSWAVPPDYADNNMDSRMCPNLVNVIINIAEVKSLFGVEMAPAGEAHSGYDNDQRVIKLMARGMSDDKADPLIKKRCEWMEVR